MAYVPPFSLSAEAIRLVAEISALMERYAYHQEQHASLKLRKANKIRTIQSSLAIEGNQLSTQQVTAIVEGRPVIAPIREIQEVKNALATYDLFSKLNPYSVKDLLKAHGQMMAALIDDAGHFRQRGVGVFAGKQAIHIAPPASQVPTLMQELFRWLRSSKDHLLIRSCVFHYEFEFIHPFSDGNGRMGRLWQSLILSKLHPLFQHLPIETMIHHNQRKYYEAINRSSAVGDSGAFVEFMLGEIARTLRAEVTPTTPTADATRQRLLEAIRQNPGVRAKHLAEALQMSQRTIERYLRQLREADVEFRGAPRNGGYYLKR